MITYNHAPFIKSALDSVLLQEHSFSWEIVIGEDCSTDDTVKILKSYEEQFPDQFKVIYNSENIGMHANAAKTILACRGEFLAFLEGDDYWIDTFKLEKQANFMITNPNLAWCSTNCIVVDEQGKHIKDIKYNLPEYFDYQYFLENPFNPKMNTLMFRKAALPPELPPVFYKVIQPDNVLIHLLSLKGEIGFLQDVTGAYRSHLASISHTSLHKSIARYKDWIVISKGLRKIVPKKYKKYFGIKRIRNAYFFMAKFYLEKELKQLLFLKYWVLSFGEPSVRDSLYYLKKFIRHGIIKTR